MYDIKNEINEKKISVEDGRTLLENIGSGLADDYNYNDVEVIE